METYQYLKRWLSAKEIKRMREGDNPLGIKLSRKQVYNIMRDKSKNFLFKNLLIERAQHNEKLSTQNLLSTPLNKLMYASQN